MCQPLTYYVDRQGVSVSIKEVNQLEFQCDACPARANISKLDGQHNYPVGWFRVVLRGKTDAGRKEYDLCDKCTGKVTSAIEEGLDLEDEEPKKEVVQLQPSGGSGQDRARPVVHFVDPTDPWLAARL